MSERIVDPGNEFSPAKPNSLPWIIERIRKHDGVDLKASEGMLLLNEIDRLAGELLLAKNALLLNRQESLK